MKHLALGLLGLSLALAGPAIAEDEVLTVTGQVVVDDTDGDGNETVRIVTETDTYLVHEASKASDLYRHKGRNVAVTGKLEVTEVGKSIVVAEYAVLEEESPAVGAQ